MTNVISTLAITCALVSVTLAAQDRRQGDPWRFRPGLRNSQASQGLSASELQVVTDSLRHETGFQQLRFDEAGFLTIGDRSRFIGGSAIARKLLVEAVDGEQVFELEAHDHSPLIAFADLTAGRIHQHAQTGARIVARQIRLDAADFAELYGSREAVAAFDPGFAVLHELAHGVLNLRDAVSEQAQSGACDELINRIRRELHLPERQGYAPRTQRLPASPGGRTFKRSELIFLRQGTESKRARTEWFYLYWDADRVALGAKSAFGH